MVAYALAFSLVTSSPIVANAATVSPDETMDDWSEIGSPVSYTHLTLPTKA